MNYVKELIEKGNLGFHGAEKFTKALLRKQIDPAHAGGVLSILAYKGEDGQEIAGAVKAILASAPFNGVLAPSFNVILDCCGTGGSGTYKLNISSAVAVVCAFFGVYVAKHGNRSASGKVGSADIFEALGWPLHITTEAAYLCMYEKKFCFLFAPEVFFAMKNAAPVRKALGIRTIFNLAGPLCNPMSANVHLLGVAKKEDMKRIANSLDYLPSRKLLLVHSEDGFDEISPLKPTYAMLTDGRHMHEEFVIDPKEFGIKEFDVEEIIGKDLEYNVSKIRELFEGKGSYGFKTAVAINSAYALYISDVYDDQKAAFSDVMDVLETGKLARFWEEVLKVIEEYKDVR